MHPLILGTYGMHKNLLKIKLFSDCFHKYSWFVKTLIHALHAFIHSPVNRTYPTTTTTITMLLETSNEGVEGVAAINEWIRYIAHMQTDVDRNTALGTK